MVERSCDRTKGSCKLPLAGQRRHTVHVDHMLPVVDSNEVNVIRYCT